jgi:hypothetical protein
MTGEFLTEGLRKDRYLKSLRLPNQFENEIKAVLKTFDQQLVDQHPELFDPSDDPRWRTNRSPNSGLALHRFNHELDGPQAPDDQRQRLNVHLYWMPPAEYARTDIDGAVRAFGYKIKGAEETTDQHVVERTRNGDWSIRTSENPYDSNVAFYNHVSSRADIEEVQAELVEHFEEFGAEYGRD